MGSSGGLLYYNMKLVECPKKKTISSLLFVSVLNFAKHKTQVIPKNTGERPELVYMLLSTFLILKFDLTFISYLQSSSLSRPHFQKSFTQSSGFPLQDLNINLDVLQNAI